MDQHAQSLPLRPPKRPRQEDHDSSSSSTSTGPSSGPSSGTSTPLPPVPAPAPAPTSAPSLPSITILPLGAGQDVGRSCILVTFSTTGRTVMLDCGMHMGFHDARMFPDFGYLTRSGNLSSAVDAVLISHFHLDHCGALPYMCKTFAYEGPVVMSAPTKAVCPILLEDFAKIQASRRGGGGGRKGGGEDMGKTAKDPLLFNQDDILACLAKVTTIDVHQTIRLKHDLEVQAFYAGHVLGAVMFLVRSGSQSILYTGDYNMTPDRHLGAAWFPPTHSPPDVLITESTYATTIRDSRRTRERDFLRKVHDTLQAGGKVLLPVFAVGRAQELAILLESYAERMHWTWPMYFVGGLTRKSMAYYRLFVHWTNQTLRAAVLANPGHALGAAVASAAGAGPSSAARPPEATVQVDTRGGRNPFDFKRIQTLPGGNNDMLWSALEAKGGMVVFASPGMLHSGLSLEIFKRWCGDKRNVVILPGYCVPGTVGAQLLAGPSEGVRGIKVPEQEDSGTRKGAGTGGGKGAPTREVRCEMRVENLAFSAHADGKGILQLIRTATPRAVVLVHGERGKMAQLVKVVHETLATPCHMPANHHPLVVPTPWVDGAVDVKVAGDVRTDIWAAANMQVGKRSVGEAVAAARFGPTLVHQVADKDGRAVSGREAGWGRVPLAFCHVEARTAGNKHEEPRIVYPAQVMHPVAGAIPPMTTGNGHQEQVTLVSVKCSLPLPPAVTHMDPVELAAFINMYSVSVQSPVFARAEVRSLAVKVVSVGQDLTVDLTRAKLVWRPIMCRMERSRGEYAKVRQVVVEAVVKFCG